MKVQQIGTHLYLSQVATVKNSMIQYKNNYNIMLNNSYINFSTKLYTVLQYLHMVYSSNAEFLFFLPFLFK